MPFFMYISAICTYKNFNTVLLAFFSQPICGLLVYVIHVLRPSCALKKTAIADCLDDPDGPEPSRQTFFPDNFPDVLFWTGEGSNDAKDETMSGAVQRSHIGRGGGGRKWYVSSKKLGRGSCGDDMSSTMVVVEEV